VPRQLGFFAQDGFDPLTGQGMLIHQHNLIRKRRDPTLTGAPSWRPPESRDQPRDSDTPGIETYISIILWGDFLL
jgi:hypothetical protein